MLHILHTLNFISHRLDSVFLIHAFVGSEFCPSMIDNIKSRNVMNFVFFLQPANIFLQLDVQQPKI